VKNCTVPPLRINEKLQKKSNYELYLYTMHTKFDESFSIRLRDLILGVKVKLAAPGPTNFFSSQQF
jgi:hypothetical protein